MSRLDHGVMAYNSSVQDVVSVHPADCFFVKDNVTSATCINGTGFRNHGLSLDDYYYYDDDAGWSFLDIYYSTTRFAVETTMALLSMTLNVLDLDLEIYATLLISSTRPKSHAIGNSSVKAWRKLTTQMHRH